MKTIAVILVAGKSTRFNSDISKQVYLLKNKPVFSYPLLAFNNCPIIDKTIVVTNEPNKDLIQNFVSFNKIKNVTIILGGSTRQESVENALKEIKDLVEDDIVIIHDGARPLIDNQIIIDTVNAAKKYGAVTTSLPLEDTTVCLNNNGKIESFIDRNKHMRIQTPQAFKFKVIVEAHKNALSNDATDDCSLVLENNQEVKLIPGNKKLTKLTTIEDIKYLETFIYE